MKLKNPEVVNWYLLLLLNYYLAIRRNIGIVLQQAIP